MKNKELMSYPLTFEVHARTDNYEEYVMSIAFSLLHPGGKMVAIMGAGAHTNERSAGFRDWLSEVGAKVYDTPEGSFNTDEAFRKTGVNTKMVVISKPTGETDISDKYAALFDESYIDLDGDWVDELYAGANQFLFDFADTKEPVSGATAKRRNDSILEEAAKNGQYRIVGTSEEHTQCERCGRSDLKKTIVVETTDADGNGNGDYQYYGSDCVSKIVGKDAGAIEKKALEADHASKVKRANNARALEMRPHTTKGEANLNYRKTNRISAGSYLAEKDGRFVRVDGKDADDVALWKSDGWKQVSEPVKPTESELNDPETSAKIRRNYPKFWDEHFKPAKYAAFCEEPLSEKYYAVGQWDESQHPRVAAGSPRGGEFTHGSGGSAASGAPSQLGQQVTSKNRPGHIINANLDSHITGQKQAEYEPGALDKQPEQAPQHQPVPATAQGQSTRLRDLPELPDRQSHHSLTLSNQDIGLQVAVKDWHRGFRRLMRDAATMGGSTTEESLWAHMDKQQLQSLVSEINEANKKSIEAGGNRLDDIFNYNGVIPKMIAERLEGGSRFYDPTQLRGRWHEEAPEQPQQAEQGAAPTPARSEPAKPEERVSKRKLNEVDAAIKAALGDNPEVIAAFRPLVFEAWDQLTKEAKDHNAAVREMTGATARTLADTVDAAGHTTGAQTMQKLSAMVRKARLGTLDPAKKKGFDELVDSFERNYPHMLGGRGEDGLIDLLTQGIKQPPDIMDEAVAQRAMTLAGPELLDALERGEPISVGPSSDIDEQVPFSWSNIAWQVEIMRCAHNATIERYGHPTEAQKEAGNYKKKHISLHGLRIAIETKKGDRRRPEWPPMPCDYGDIKGTEGNDGDPVDVFVGPNLNSEFVCVVDQVSKEGSFDEHKVLFGFDNESDAIACYKKAYTADWKVGPVTTMTVEQFKAWLKAGKQSKPIAKQVSKYSHLLESVLAVGPNS